MTEQEQKVDVSAPIPAAVQDSGWNKTQEWLQGKAAKAAAPEPAPKAEAPKAAPEAPEAKPVEPKASGTKKVADALLGKKEPESKPSSGWDENANRALSRIGLRDNEIEELAALSKEKEWVPRWLQHLQKLQSKQDADYAALKTARAGDETREPTPGARSQPAHTQGDQPGSGEVAELLDTLATKFADEIGDDNATLLRRAFEAFGNENRELRRQLDGLTQGVRAEKEAAEIEAMAQRARTQLRGDFPWLDNDERFDAVAVEMARLRPDEITPEGVLESMRKAARIVGYDDVVADAKAVASQRDSTRKTRLAESAPNGSSAAEGAVLSDFEISQQIIARRSAGEPAERIRSWVQDQHERRRRAAR